jgi:hypothetical protein
MTSGNRQLSGKFTPEVRAPRPTAVSLEHHATVTEEHMRTTLRMLVAAFVLATLAMVMFQVTSPVSAAPVVNVFYEGDIIKIETTWGRWLGHEFRYHERVGAGAQRTGAG